MIEYDLIKNSRIFHFGSLSLTDEPSKSATLAALSFAKDNGCIISYDPNLRPVLWKNLNNALSEITSTLGYSDILKISEDELEFITGIADLEKGSLELYKRYGIKIILITRGANGCFLRFRDRTGSKPTFTKCKTIDTTGAGDAFLGGFLFSLLSKNLGSLDELDWHLLEEMTVFSNAVASLSTQKKGAIPAMPGLDEINELLRTG
jgi:sugar/nucleoside kinase (ribokinase family)